MNSIFQHLTLQRLYPYLLTLYKVYTQIVILYHYSMRTTENTRVSLESRINLNNENPHIDIYPIQTCTRQTYACTNALDLYFD